MARSLASVFSFLPGGLAFVLAVSLCCSGAAAQDAAPEASVELTPDQAVELATRWLEQGRIDPAEKLVAKLRAVPDPPLQVLFLSGHVKLAKGDLTGAVEEFREILRKDPKAVRVRLDLALALYKLKDYRAALYHFELALSADLPPQAKANAVRFVREIRQRQSYWEINFGLISDTNVNYATRATEVPIGEARFQLSDDARAQSGTGLQLSISGRESFGPELDNFVNVYAEDSNFAGSQFDLFYGVLTLGHTFALAAHDLSFEAGGQYANWGERSLYAGYVGKIADNWRLRPDTNLVTSVDARELRYADFQYLNGVQYALNFDLTRSFFGNSAVRAGYSLIRQEAPVSSSAYKGYGVRFEAQTELAHSFTVGARTEHYRFTYDAPDPLFGSERIDRRDLLELSVLRRDIAWHGFSPRLIFGYSRGTSTIPLYEFDRKYVRVFFTRAF